MQAGGATMRHIRVRGVPTEEYAIPAVSGSSSSSAASSHAAAVQYTAVIIPGNPGSAHYYVPFAHAIHKHLGGGVNVRAVSLAGHSLPPPPRSPPSSAAAADGKGGDHTTTAAAVSSARVYVLQDQVVHVGAYLDQLKAELLAASGPGVAHRFVLFGHSIGAYIGFHATVGRSVQLQGGGGDDVAQVVCMFPFVRFDLSRVQNAMFRLLFAIRPLALLFIRFAQYLPQSVRVALVKLFTDIRAEFAIQATTRVFFIPQLVRNGLTLGENEFDTVPRHFDVPLYRAYAHKLTFLYTALHDHWAPVAQYHHLKSLLADTPAQFRLVEHGVRHAFVVYPDQYQRVAALCGDRMLQVMGATTAGAVVPAAAAGAGARARGNSSSGSSSGDVSVAVASSPTTAHKSAL